MWGVISPGCMILLVSCAMEIPCAVHFISCSLSNFIAIIAHEGPVANEGHYTTFVNMSMFAMLPLAAEDNRDWCKFDDDNVSVISKEKLSTLYGGGTFCVNCFSLASSSACL